MSISYYIDETDYAMDVYKKVCDAMRCALKLHSSNMGHSKIYQARPWGSDISFGKKPEDGLIDWNLSGKEIETLIRATSKPYPGAFSFYNDSKVIFWKAKLEETRNL